MLGLPGPEILLDRTLSDSAPTNVLGWCHRLQVRRVTAAAMQAVVARQTEPFQAGRGVAGVVGLESWWHWASCYGQCVDVCCRRLVVRERKSSITVANRALPRPAIVRTATVIDEQPEPLFSGRRLPADISVLKSSLVVHPAQCVTVGWITTAGHRACRALITVSTDRCRDRNFVAESACMRAAHVIDAGTVRASLDRAKHAVVRVSTDRFQKVLLCVKTTSMQAAHPFDLDLTRTAGHRTRCIRNLPRTKRRISQRRASHSSGVVSGAQSLHVGGTIAALDAARRLDQIRHISIVPKSDEGGVRWR